MTLADVQETVRRIRTMRGRVRVGVPAGAAEHNSGASLAMVARVHEYGAHVAPHSRIHGQTMWFNPTNGRMVSRMVTKTKLTAVIETKAKPATFANGITIPARPFLRQGIENNKDALHSLATKSLTAVARGGMDIGTALGKLGLAAQRAIQREIRDGAFAPLRPATIRRKGSTKPLIDSGSLRQGVTFTVETD